MDKFKAEEAATLQQHLRIPALLVLGEAIRLILEKRRSGKRVDISKGGALIKAKATSTSRVKKHYNCGPIVLDWCERFMVKDQHHADAIELLKQGAPAHSQDIAPPTTHPLIPTSQEQMFSSPHPHRLPSPPPLGLQPSPPATTTPPTLPSSHPPPGTTTIDDS